MAIYANALHKLSRLLEPEGMPVLNEICHDIARNPAVLAHGLLFEPWALREFLWAFRTGMTYAAQEYPASIPADITFWRNPEYCGMPFNDIIYRSSAAEGIDDIAISHVYIAFFANAVQHGIIARACDHLPEGYAASAATCAICHAIEECYHRHQVHARGEAAIVRPGERDNPLEEAIFPVIEKAIQDLHLSTHRMS